MSILCCSCFSHVQNTPQPCCQSTTLKNMTISIRTKVLIKFGASEMMYVELRAKKPWNVYTLLYIWKVHSHMYKHTSTMSPVNKTHWKVWLLALEQRHWSSLELQRWYVWNWGVKNPWNVYTLIAVHVKSSFSHVQNTPQPCRQLTKPKYMTISIQTRILIASEMMCVELRVMIHHEATFLCVRTRFLWISKNRPLEKFTRFYLCI